MKHEEFKALVQRLESYAQQNPSSYRVRLGLLAALGYFYIFLVLVVALALIPLCIWVVWRAHGAGSLFLKVIIGLLILVYIILRSLWVQFPRPEGLELHRDTTPKLFAMIDELVTALQAPRFHHVLLNSDFNCAVLQRPRLGILGWQENYLLLGLPMMQSLSPEQFKAVVAHELGHLSGNHSRFAGWIYRVRRTWGQILVSLEEQGHKGAFVFNAFLNWYIPYFEAYSFVLARADEYVADRCAADLAGPQAAAQALLATQVSGQFLDSKFWPDIFKRANAEAEPPSTVFASMFQALRQGAPPEQCKTWVQHALREQTSYDDTHPSLADRLRALGQPLAPNELDSDGNVACLAPSPQHDTAAGHFLGDALESVTKNLEESWRAHILPLWQERHTRIQETRKQLETIENKAQQGILSEEEQWQRVEWTAEVEGNAPAIALLRTMHASQPDDVRTNYGLGQLLLEEEDDEGIAYIEKAMTKDRQAVLDGCALIYGFLKQQGQHEEAERYRDRAEHHVEAMQQLQHAHGVLFTVTEPSLQRLRKAKNESEILQIIQEDLADANGEPQPRWIYDLDTSWDAIHHCLTAIAAASGQREHPLKTGLRSGKPLSNTDEHLFYTCTPDAVAAISAVLTTMNKETLHELYFKLNKKDYRFPLSDADFEYTWTIFEKLPAFYNRVVSSGRAVVFMVDK